MTVVDCLRETLKTHKYPPISSPLPSKGLIYPSNHIFSQLGRVFYTILTSKDEDWSSTPPFSANTYMLNLILENKILFNNDPHINVDDMLLADRDIMIINHLVQAYGYEFNGIALNCSNCNEKVSTKDLKIQRIGFETLKLKPEIPYSNTFSYKIPNERNEIITFKFPTVKDYSFIEKVATDYIQTDQWLDMILIRVNNMSKEQSKKYLMSEVLFTDFMDFREFVETNEPYTQFFTNKLICGKCGKDNTIQSRISFNLLQLNTVQRKEIMMKKLHFLMKELNMDWDQIYEMPLDVVSRIIKRNEQYINEIKGNESNTQ